MFHRLAGTDTAVTVLRARRGTHFDPALVDAVTEHPGPVFDGISEPALGPVLEAEPVERRPLSEDELDVVLAAVADFGDLRCHHFAGHARTTATLATAAARHLQMPQESVRLLHRAALVHDLGRAGVPAAIWSKPGPLTEAEQDRVRLHTYYVERMFTHPEPLHRIGVLAASHHERMDGSGYHRGIGGALISLPARLLAAADVAAALGADRPHRPALRPDHVAAGLRQQARTGHLDPMAVDAILTAMGRPSAGSRAAGPAAREAEILGLLALGHSNKTIAVRLGISPKTVANHIEHIYTKLGVSNRAAATLHAMEHGLVPARRDALG